MSCLDYVLYDIVLYIVLIIQRTT